MIMPPILSSSENFCGISWDVDDDDDDEEEDEDDEDEADNTLIHQHLHR
jgi:hypothetical protein